MAPGKTYSTKYLVDSNGNTGAANQVLVSTATGIDWVDGSGSVIIGGPYLPLSAGASYPLTGDLHLSTGLIKLASQITTKIELVANQMTLYAGGLQVLTGYNASQDGVEIGNPTGDMDIKLSSGANNKVLFLEGSSGNVGIGTTGPTEKLHVDGSTLVTYNNSFQSTNSVGNKAILARVSPTSGIINYAEYATATNLNGFVIGSTDAQVKGVIATDSLEFITNGSTSMKILSGGDVGIGNTNPKTKLDINGTIGFGSKSMSLTDSFSDALTVNMSNHTGCYVKITAFGDWSSHSSMAYLGEFFLQNGADGYNEPGIIIRQVDNTSTDDIQAQIVDPASGAGTRYFVIQLKTTSASGTPTTANLQYEVRGQYNSVS